MNVLRLAVFMILAAFFSSCQKPAPAAKPGPAPAEAPPPAELPPLESPPLPSPVPEPQATDQSPLPAAPSSDAMDEILAADIPPGEASTRLLALLPTLPEEEKSFVVQLAGNYCPDEEYWRLLPSLLDRTLPEDCRDELMNDVLRRPDYVRLRPLYRLATDPTHPLSAEARDYLFSYFPDVPDNDFNALARAVDQGERESRINEW